MIKSAKNGTLIGMVAGAMMAMVAMIATAATGDGFWTPVNAIAHTVWDGAPLDTSFSAGALALGVGLHMAVSMMLGIGIALLVAGRAVARGTTAVLALGAAMAAWLVQLAAWPAVDEAAAEATPQWVLFVGHAVFGMVAAVLVRVTAGGRDHHHRVDGTPAAIPVG